MQFKFYKFFLYHQYQVMGRALPTERRTYFLRKLKKIYKKSPTKIKNYGIWLQYQSRTGYLNMYKEYRGTALNGGMYTNMASRHRLRSPCIQIIKTTIIPAKLCKRKRTQINVGNFHLLFSRSNKVCEYQSATQIVQTLQVI
ncbi:hypothetical protein MKX01_035084 [Papaver californicum]|nr:hypothetical protein MKX01_035084 [Papaver californicum]